MARAAVSADLVELRLALEAFRARRPVQHRLRALAPLQAAAAEGWHAARRLVQQIRTAGAPLLAAAGAQGDRAWQWARGQADYLQSTLRPALQRLTTERARVRREINRYSRQPQTLRYLVIADGALAASFTAALIIGGPLLQAPLPAPLAARAHLAGQRFHPTPVLPTATPTPLPTATPTATPEPLLTATPIPTLFSEWESSLPLQGGWNGLAECWGGVLAPQGTGRFRWPTDKRYLVGWDYRYWHPGLDLGGEVGDPLYAADAGVVVYAGWNVYGFGNLVIIDHGNGWHTLYAHLSETHVTCGQGVTQGALLGLAGSTGRSTGPHLHFEMRLNGVNVNPWDYLPAP